MKGISKKTCSRRVKFLILEMTTFVSVYILQIMPCLGLIFMFKVGPKLSCLLVLDEALHFHEKIEGLSIIIIIKFFVSIQIKCENYHSSWRKTNVTSIEQKFRT